MNAGNIRFKLTRSSLWHILWLGGSRLQWAAGIAILRVVLVLDVSKYQGVIDFLKMINEGVKGVIIKCGQGFDLDPFFLLNWAKAKIAGLPRGSYWFYDSRVDPREQARKWANWISQDKGELKCWLDLEESYGGKYSGWQNWKIFLQEFMRLSGLTADDIGIYTGYYYWIAHTPTNLADLNWFGQFWLWLAWYTTNPANVIIPKPWTKLTFWQYGTMGVDGKTANGKRYGVESLEVDENNFNGDIELYQQLFGLGTVVTPPPDGGTMKGLVSVSLGSTLQIREQPTAGSKDLGDLHRGDVVYGEVKAGWIGYKRVYRVGGAVEAIAGYSSTAYMKLTDEQEPGGEPPAPPAEKKIIKAILHFDDASTAELFPK